MTKILVVGSSGLLGSWFSEEASKFNWTIKTVSKSHAADYQGDFSDWSFANSCMQEFRPGIIVNLVALTDVDRCEREPHEAYQLHMSVPENIARYMQTEKNCWALQISTDQVYDGEGYKKEENVSIKNIYSLSKRAGEMALPSDRTVVLRTNFFGRSVSGHRKSFTDWAYGAFLGNEKITLFSDSIFNPLHGRTVAKIMCEVIKMPRFGIFNLGSHDGLSKADFVIYFAKLVGVHKEIYTISKSVTVPDRARRPLNMLMDVSKFESTYNLPLPSLKEEINKTKDEYHV